MIFPVCLYKVPKKEEDEGPYIPLLIHTEYIQQSELSQQILEQLNHLLKQFADKEGVYFNMARGVDYPVDGPECIYIKVTVRIEPRKEIRIK